MNSGYVNPIPKTVTPERVDMGVDYAGTGNLLALGDGVVTQVVPGGWGQYGNYIAYRLTSGPQAGKYIYYAEGVTPHVSVGQRLSAGQIVASLIPGWHSGIEVGYGNAGTDSTYADTAGGGYSEGAHTAAGQAFSDLIKSLGGPAGVAGSAPVTGTAPPAGGAAAGGAAATAGDTGTSVGGLDLNPVDAIKSFFAGVWKTILGDAKYAALALIAILGGFVLLGKGISRATHDAAAVA